MSTPKRKQTDIDQARALRFKQVRKWLRLTQKEMAALCRVSQAIISLIEKGEREIPSNVLGILLLEKNISPAYILSGVDGIEYKRSGGMASEVSEMRAELEMVKARLGVN